MCSCIRSGLSWSRSLCCAARRTARASLHWSRTARSAFSRTRSPARNCAPLPLPHLSHRQHPHCQHPHRQHPHRPLHPRPQPHCRRRGEARAPTSRRRAACASWTSRVLPHSAARHRLPQRRPPLQSAHVHRAMPMAITGARHASATSGLRGALSSACTCSTCPRIRRLSRRCSFRSTRSYSRPPLRRLRSFSLFVSRPLVYITHANYSG